MCVYVCVCVFKTIRNVLSKNERVEKEKQVRGSSV